jgi:hypothetical protein
VTRSVEIPDEAVEVAAKAIWNVPPVREGRASWEFWNENNPRGPEKLRAQARAALVAARPYLMPSREEIAEALHREKHSEACLFSNPSNCDQFRQAVQESAVVLALLSTSGESGEGPEFICLVSPDGRRNTVPARGGDDELLGYNHCGYCGTKLDW